MDKLVLEVAVEYQRSMRLVGRKFIFPRAKDITATYPYRAIQAFVAKCRSIHHFDGDMIKETVKIVVRYARDNKLLSVGPAILNRSDIVDICCKVLNRELKDRDYLADSLTIMNKFINAKSSDRIAYLKDRPKRKGYPNLIALRSSNDITDTFICLSKSSINVLTSLDCDERAVISSLVDLAKMRQRVINHLGADAIRQIFGSDSNV